MSQNTASWLNSIFKTSRLGQRWFVLNEPNLLPGGEQYTHVLLTSHLLPLEGGRFVRRTSVDFCYGVAGREVYPYTLDVTTDQTAIISILHDLQSLGEDKIFNALPAQLSLFRKTAAEVEQLLHPLLGKRGRPVPPDHELNEGYDEHPRGNGPSF